VRVHGVLRITGVFNQANYVKKQSSFFIEVFIDWYG